MAAGRDRLEQGRAQGRREAQGEERREQDRHRHGHRELLVDDPHRALHEGHRQEHRHQHQGDADDRAADLAHGLARRLPRAEAFLGHDALDVLHHHDGIVDQDADGQHHAEQRQHVDREPQRQHQGEGTSQGHGYDQGGDERVAQVLQEQVHHREHQHHGLEQGHDHLLDRGLDEGRRVVGDVVLHARRKLTRQLLQRLAHPCRGLHGVGAGRQLHGEGAGGLAVQARAVLVFLCADLDTGDIAQGHHGPVGVGPQHDRGELGRVAQLPFDDDVGGDFLGRPTWQVTDTAGRHLGVLRSDGVDHVGGRQAQADQLARVDPDPHGPFRAVQLRFADAFETTHFVHHVARQVIAQGDLVQAAVRGGQGRQQQETGGDLLHLQALLGHRPWQA